MKNFKILSILLFGLMVYVVGCKSPNEITGPTHINRVPKPIWSAVNYDTTASGAYRVYLKWTVSSMDSIKDFEIKRAIDNSTFVTIKSLYATTYIDTFAYAKDSLVVNYYLIPNGKKFIGEYSSTLTLNLKKK
jgi:hypothetical protein